MSEKSVRAEARTIGERTAGMEKFPGYFTYYWDEKTGKIWLEIEKFDLEFLYVISLTAGIGSNEVGLDRVQLGGTKIVKFQRIGPKVLLIQPNYSFRAISNNPDERKAVEDSFAKSVIWGFEAEAEEKDSVLVDATPFLLRDARNVVSTLKQRNQGDYELDLTRSAIYLPGTKNFLPNTEFEVLSTFKAREPGSLIQQVAPDPRSITIRQHHSFVQLPDDDYEPRVYDPRANFNGMRYMDYATPVNEPIVKRVITRHRLRKKDPNAEVSEPVEPIVYYVDRGAPEPIRSALIEGASWWNQAFEAIGYKDAFQVKLLPEGADPMDVRYNMINWIHRSTRGWSYGASVTDPRTGEIIKGHANIGSLRVRQDYLIAEGVIAEYEEGKAVSPEALEMALARIRQLSVHEVGHTLGMGHNYASNVNDRASVMDYPAPLVKIREDGSLDLSEAYAKGIGEWDKVSIAYGYQDFPDGVDEEKELKAILENAFSRGLLFIPGQDTGPGGAHPLAAPWVNGKHPVDELERIMKVRSIALRSFSEKKIRSGAPMATIEEVLVPIYLFHRYQVEAAASVLGGLYYYHTLRGDVQKNPEMVPASEQWRALDVLLKTIQPENLAMPEELLKLIPPRPPTYPQTEDLFPGHTGLTFDHLGAAETVANLTVGLLLHPERAARLVEYHSRHSEVPAFTEVVDQLISFTWKSSQASSYRAEIQRVVDNVVLYHLMKLAANEEAAAQVRSVAYLKLDELKDWLSQQAKSMADEDQKAHYLYAASQIKLFQDNPDKVKLTVPLNPPKGPPI
jgi:hypothetical protein